MCQKPGLETSTADVQLTNHPDVEKGPAAVDVVKEAELVWSDINYTLFAGKKKEKKVLQGVSGQLPPASLLAIMGPSGSGKSSLLNVCAPTMLLTHTALSHVCR